MYVYCVLYYTRKYIYLYIYDDVCNPTCCYTRTLYDNGTHICLHTTNITIPIADEKMFNCPATLEGDKKWQ